MKKLNVIYNHNIFEEPYNQVEVKKTASRITEQFGEVELFVTHTNFASPNPFFYDLDLIMVEHTFEMTSEEKKALASILNLSVTKLKRCEPIDVVVSFRKIEEDDLYFFEAKK